jgi:hypothetical protein
MIIRRPSGRSRKYVRYFTHLCAGLALALFLTSCGQTAEIGTRQPGQTPEQAQAGDKNQQTDRHPDKQKFPHARGEVLVKFSPEIEAQVIEQIQKELHLETIRKFSSPNLFLMKITNGTSVEKTIERLNRYESVKYAEPNFEVRISE